MGLSDSQKVYLLNLVKDNWLDAQETLHAYVRIFSVNKKISDWLKIGTFIAAIITALTAAIPALLSKNPIFIWLTPISGFLTAVLVAAENQFSPTKRTQDTWEYRNQLDTIKRDLSSFPMYLDSFPDLKSAMDALNQIVNRLTNTKKIPMEIKKVDKDLAQAEYENSAIAKMILRFASADEDIAEPNDALGYDAPGVVEVTRGKML